MGKMPHFMNRVQIALVQTQKELEGILELQQKNLAHAISSEDQKTEGFVTVEHDLNVLHLLNEQTCHAVAKYEDRVVGYALGMAKNFQNEIPVLAPMFERINILDYKTDNLTDVNYLIMGQVCISKDFRGKGIFGSLFNLLRSEHSHRFRYLITEVAKRNSRSLRAHEKVGFKKLHEYTDQEEWVILIWEWNN